MKLAGDPAGLEELKYIKENKLFYLKYLLKEAQTSTYRMVEFRGQDGKKKFRLKYFPDKDEFMVEQVNEGTSS
jgi:uncharacterized protein YkuJ